MSTPDNFKFADIPAPSTPEEKRFVELVRAVVRDELRKHDDAFMTAVSASALSFGLAFQNSRGAS